MLSGTYVELLSHDLPVKPDLLTTHIRPRRTVVRGNPHTRNPRSGWPPPHQVQVASPHPPPPQRRLGDSKYLDIEKYNATKLFKTYGMVTP